MPDLLTELQSALAAGMPIKGITDNDIGRWKTGIVPQAMYEDAIVGALMRFCWDRGWHIEHGLQGTIIDTGNTWGNIGEDETGPLPLLRAVREAWEATK